MQRDAALKPVIKRVWKDHVRVYGAPKVWRRMNREGVAVAVRRRTRTNGVCLLTTVERLMREMGLSGVGRGKKVRTTAPDAGAPRPMDKVNRNFRAPAPNRLWVSDFTYVSTWSGLPRSGRSLNRWRTGPHPSSSTPSPVGSLAGGSAGRRMQASSWMPWNRRVMPEGLPPVAAWCIAQIAAASRSRSSLPSALQKRAWSLPSAASATAMTKPWPRRSSDCSRPRSFTGAGRGNHSVPSNTPRSNGSTGATTGDPWSPPATSRRQRRRATSTQPCCKPLWLITPPKWPPRLPGRFTRAPTDVARCAPDGTSLRRRRGVTQNVTQKPNLARKPIRQDGQRHENTGRGRGTRTPDPRFWRPMLYQLSYTPAVRRDGLIGYAKRAGFSRGPWIGAWLCASGRRRLCAAAALARSPTAALGAERFSRNALLYGYVVAPGW